ncbi:permease [Cohnella endophytica]|uniref:Permease n=1 Tax=Cohnella endophytica TaxID=2419778 RepID=A0A494Y0P2_9BACL|nr:permease [Cohnella endophytica]RKP53997.1 permease [Cohnella endophytica]
MANTATEKKPNNWNSNTIAGLGLALILLLYFFSANAPGTILNNPKLQIFKSVFISIILEAMPFILIGVFISALIQVFVSDQMIQRVIPKNPILGIITASVLGIIFPLCECGMVPAIRKLIKKGMPLYAATTFILVGPILNPVVFLSTLTAFRSRPEIAYARMGLAFAVALVIGLIVYRFVNKDQLKGNSNPSVQAHSHSHHHSEPHEHVHVHGHNDHRHPRPNKIVELMGHTVSEFFDMGKYLIFGSVLVGLLQTFVAQSSLVALGQGQGSSNLIMMGLGFILSLCSTSDAFVAQSFMTTFSKGSLVAFMVFGPMLNLKGLLMMLAVFKTRFVVLMSILVFVFVYVGTIILEMTLFK